MKDYRNGMSTEEYRRSYPYRRKYFEKNPGLFGCIWICSQCGKPLFGRKNVVVDHIMPLNKGGENNERNCTSICQKCNSSKSDVVDSRVLRGKIFKVFERNASMLNRGLGASLMLMLGFGTAVVDKSVKVGTGVTRVSAKAGAHIIGGAFRLAGKIVTYPLTKGPVLSRLFMLVVYAVIVLQLLSSNTSLLDAFMR